MIGLLISVLIEGIALMVSLLIIMLRLLIRGSDLLVAAVASAVQTRRRISGARVGRDPIAQSLRWAVFQRDGYACTHCGSHSDLTVDHIHPVSLGGGNSADNLQTLCRPCNSRKGAF